MFLDRPYLNLKPPRLEGKAKIGKVDVDENQQIAIKFGVRSIPTLLIFKDGKLKDTIIGAVPKSQIVTKLNSAL